MDGVYSSAINDYHIIDCRFDYEYHGGHISGAVNINNPKDIKTLLLGPSLTKPKPCVSGDPSRKTLLVFHCEFSVQRAPTLYVPFVLLDDDGLRILGRSSYVRKTGQLTTMSILRYTILKFISSRAVILGISRMHLNDVNHEHMLPWMILLMPCQGRKILINSAKTSRLLATSLMLMAMERRKRQMPHSRKGTLFPQEIVFSPPLPVLRVLDALERGVVDYQL
jgi:hypothetical protein